MAIRETLDVPTVAASDSGEPRLGASGRGRPRSLLRELLATAMRPELLSFTLGVPANELFPRAAFRRAADQVLAHDPAALQYGLPSPPLKAHVVELMRWRGVVCREEQVFLTTGAQQGMDLLTRLLLKPGGGVLLEETVYEGIQTTVGAWCPEPFTVPTSADRGLDVEAVEALLARGERPAFLYVIPEGHNPLGGSLRLERRRRLLELAKTFGLPLIEDDAYGLLSYDGTPALPLRALDDRQVLYLGSFSKILAPALRVGWIVTPAELVPGLSALKHGADLDTATLAQRTLAAYLDSGALPQHLETVRAEYRRRRDAMLAALARYLPPTARWCRPASGMFVWVELAPGVDTVELLGAAIDQEGVAFCPGAAFATGGRHHADHCLRLSFAALPPEQIELGIAKLGRVLERFRPAG